MSTTVRIREDDKRKLDELQARLTLTTGQRVPLEEVLHRVLQVAGQEEDRILDRPPEMTEERKQELDSLTFDLGHPTREEEIDDILYGGREGAS